MRVKDVKKVVLAYSGGLDTSVILRWLSQLSLRGGRIHRGHRAGRGHGPARQKAEMFGAKESCR